MRPIRPKLLAPQVQVAEDQLEYAVITAAKVDHPAWTRSPHRYNTLVLAFEPSAEERSRLAAGEAIYVSLLTFGGPMQPIILGVGAAETAAMYGVEVER